MPRKSAQRRAREKNLAIGRAVRAAADAPPFVHSILHPIVEPIVGLVVEPVVDHVAAVPEAGAAEAVVRENQIEVEAEPDGQSRGASPDEWDEDSSSGDDSTCEDSSGDDAIVEHDSPPAPAHASRKRGRYTGDSERTRFRRAAAIAHAKRTTRSIMDFFKPVAVVEEEHHEFESSEEDGEVMPDPDLPLDVSDSDDPAPAERRPGHVRRAVTADDVAIIDADIGTKKDLADHGEEVMWLRAIMAYWRAVLSKGRGSGRHRASKVAAKALVDGGEYAARKIRRFAMEYLRTGEIPQSNRGAHSKVQSVIDIPFIRDDALAYLDERRRTCPAAFLFWIKDNLESNGLSTIKQNTARKWMLQLGFVKQSRKKGVYYDGHDRPDVQQYLHDIYLPALEAIEVRRRMFVGDDMTDVILPEDKSQPEIRLAFHDEAIWYANDIEATYYAREGDQELPKKGQGRCVHVSDFLTEELGWLDLERHIPPDRLEELRRLNKLPDNLKSRVVILPGKNHDGWWDCKQLLVQLAHFLDLFDLIHAGDICMCVFDCSSNHQAFAEDALVVSRMNVTPGGKQGMMRDTAFVHAAQRHLPEHQQVLTTQTMVYPADHPRYPGKAKGMLAVARERGLVAEDSKLNQRCAACKSTSLKDPTGTACCLTRVLSLEPDFANEKSAIQNLCEERGHRCLFLPKFHCELNPIECAWGASKFTCRRECDYSFPHLKERVPRSLDEIPISTIRRWFRLTDRFRDSYKRGLVGRLADFAVRKYKSHRRLPSSVANAEIEAAYNAKHGAATLP